MKKSLIFLGTALLVCSLTTFGFMNWNAPDTSQPTAEEEEIPTYQTALFHLDQLNPLGSLTDFELFYDVDTRFINKIDKSTLHNANTLQDILPPKATQGIASFQSMRIMILADGRETEAVEISPNEVLTEAQRQLVANN